ncbi:MAG TPA: tetratricopeptide repeat protein [Pirellulaceae bacterium]|jgi:tetratricopeptide (TPR) repeat protein
MWRFIALIVFVVPQNLAAAFEAGDQLVAIKPADMKTITGSTYVVTTGTPVTVRAADGDKLKVAAPRVGWIDASTVIPVKEAEAYFSSQADKGADKAEALLARGKVRFNQAGLDDDKVKAAIADLDESIRLQPTSEAHTYRGFAYKRLGDKDKAIAEFDEAIRLNPKEALAWRVRGATYAAKANYAKQLADYTESIRVDPENPDSRHHRVVLRSACVDEKYRDGKQAIDDATKACEMSEWENYLYLSGLAMAYAESGDFDAAVKWQQKVVYHYKSPPASYVSNLELYKQHKPFRMTWK